MSKNRLALLLPLALFSLPAFACGGGHALSHTQWLTIQTAFVTAPALAALLVDRGAFTLASYAMGLKRRHQPSAVGPLVGLAALTVSAYALTRGTVDLAVAGLALVPVAAALNAVSFVRSVVVEMRGQPAAQAVRVAAVVGFVALALALR